MRKADKIKLSVIVGVSLLAFVVGCVDTAVQPLPTSVDYKSEVSVVNLTAGTGTATINVYNGVADADSLARNILYVRIDPSSVAMSGSGDIGSTVPASNYQEVPSGQKAIVVSYTSATADTFRLTFDSQRKLQVFLIGDASAGGRSFVKSDERYTWQSPGSKDGAALFPANIGQLKIVNGILNDTLQSVEIKGGSLDTTVTFSDGMVMGDISQYIEVPTGETYTVYFKHQTLVTNVDSLTNFTPSTGRYTAIFYNDTTNVQVKVLTDD